MREIRTLRCDVEGTGNVAWSRYCDTRRRKSELTVNTNFDLNRRASPRPYLCGARSETSVPTAIAEPVIGRAFARPRTLHGSIQRRTQSLGLATVAVPKHA